MSSESAAAAGGGSSPSPSPSSSRPTLPNGDEQQKPSLVCFPPALEAVLEKARQNLPAGLVDAKQSTPSFPSPSSPSSSSSSARGHNAASGTGGGGDGGDEGDGGECSACLLNSQDSCEKGGPPGGEQEDPEEHDCRKPFLQFFVFLTCLGSAVLTGAQACFEGHFSTTTLTLGSTALVAAALLFLSLCSSSTGGGAAAAAGLSFLGHRPSLKTALYSYCIFLDLVLTICVLTDSQVRDLYVWFLTIPFLMLYLRGIRACMYALATVCVQTALLRCLRGAVGNDGLESPIPIRHTAIGEVFCDAWLFLLLTTLSICHYNANLQSLKSLKESLHEKDLANQELKRMTQAKSQFLADITHELRTPLHGIIAMSRELQENPQSSGLECDQPLSIITDCAEHLLSLINDILDFERIESNKLELESIPFSISEEVQKVVHLLRVTSDKKHLNVFYNIDTKNVFRLGDPLRFRQILFNLLSNAIKFTQNHGSIWVSVNNDPDNQDLVIVVVKDTGIGIKQEHLGLIFSPYSQAESSTYRKFGGSGLGLAISRRLCEAMGGSIICDSVPKQGSTFTCTFQMPSCKGPKAQASPSVDHHPPDDSKKVCSGQRILLVEDNVINQKVTMRMLSDLGCNVTLARNGQECLHILVSKEESYDLVLMDCLMPVMDGFEATKRIRSQSHPETLPIIALTASPTKQQTEKCFAAGMSDVLFKPFSPEQLASTISKWSSTSKKRC